MSTKQNKKKQMPAPPPQLIDMKAYQALPPSNPPLKLGLDRLILNRSGAEILPTEAVMMSSGEKQKERKEAPMDTVAGVRREQAIEGMEGVEYERLKDHTWQALALVSTQMTEYSTPNMGSESLSTNAGGGRVNSTPVIMSSMPLHAESSLTTSKYQSAFQPGINAEVQQREQVHSASTPNLWYQRPPLKSQPSSQTQSASQPSPYHRGGGGGRFNSAPMPLPPQQRPSSQPNSNAGAGRRARAPSDLVIPGMGMLFAPGNPEAQKLLQPPMSYPGGWAWGWPQNAQQQWEKHQQIEEMRHQMEIQYRQEQQHLKALETDYPDSYFDVGVIYDQQQVHHPSASGANYGSSYQQTYPDIGSVYEKPTNQPRQQQQQQQQQQQGMNTSSGEPPTPASLQFPGTGVGKYFWPGVPVPANAHLMSSQPGFNLEQSGPRPDITHGPQVSTVQGPNSFLSQLQSIPQLRGQTLRPSTPGSTKQVLSSISASQQARPSSGNFTKVTNKLPASLISTSPREPQSQSRLQPQRRSHIRLPHCHPADPARLSSNRPKVPSSTTSSPDLPSSITSEDSEGSLPGSTPSSPVLPVQQLFPPDTRTYDQARTEHEQNLENLQKNLEYRAQFSSFLRHQDTAIAKKVSGILGTDRDFRKSSSRRPVVLGEHMERVLEVVRNWSGEGWVGWGGWEEHGERGNLVRERKERKNEIGNLVSGRGGCETRMGNSEVFVDRETYFEGAEQEQDSEADVGGGEGEGSAGRDRNEVLPSIETDSAPAPATARNRNVSQRGRVITATERAMGSGLAGRGSGGAGGRMQTGTPIPAQNQIQGGSGRLRGRIPGPARHR